MRRLTVVAAAALGLLGAGHAPIPYPDGFRTWTHVSSALAGPASPAAPKYEGVHHIYANPAAVAGYRSGRFPDGAVIVFDQWTAVRPGGDATAAGERKFIDVMVRDSGAWRYTEFAAPDRRRVVEIEENQKRCDGCHEKNAPGGDRVFSELRD